MPGVKSKDLEIDLRDGEELQILEEGDCFGYPSIINRAAPAFDVVARGDVRVHAVPAALFRQLLQNAGFAEFFLASLGERLQRGIFHRLCRDQRLAQVTAAYEAYRRDGVLPASYEVVYGHAWSPQNKDATRHDIEVGLEGLQP